MGRPQVVAPCKCLLRACGRFRHGKEFMTTIEQREKVYRMLASNPEIRRLAARALEVEDQGWLDQPDYYLGWEWHQIPMAAAKLRVLVEEGALQLFVIGSQF
ncbi:hypothetical protein LCGC14_3064320 [marine sediment metagenome]|uniref:Uncharacterized protein n=1 Tax=marine sediment metagenome TaxID=412755 RepID=A0A0F8YQR1_9ZZZZ